MTIPQAPPPPPAGFQPQANVGALVRFVVRSYDPKAVTPWGARPQVVSDVDVIADSEQAGESFSEIKLSGKTLAPQLGQVVGREVFGRVAAKPGQNANPAIWLDVLRPGDEQIIQRWRVDARAGTSATAPARQHDYRNEPDWQDNSTPPPPTEVPANGAQRGSEPVASGYVPPSYGQPADDEPPY